MKIDIAKLNLALARACKNARQLRPEVSPQTLQRIYSGAEIKPQTVGRLAKALGVDPVEIIEQEGE